MLFTFFFALSMYFAVRSLLDKGSRNEMLAAYALMALATLTKGLIGVVLPALILGGFIVVRGDWRKLLEAKLQWGIPIFLLIVLPWVMLVDQATDGKWLRDFILIHHIKRYTAGAGHRQPFYYYFTSLPVDFLPSTIFAVPALVAYRLRRKFFQEDLAFLYLMVCRRLCVLHSLGY